MKISKRKFSELKTEAGIDDKQLSGLMGYADNSGLSYWVRKIESGETVKETVIRRMLDAFSAKLGRAIGIDELVASLRASKPQPKRNQTKARARA